MAIETLYEKDGSIGPLTATGDGGGPKVAVLGYGSQGHAHAQNLRESGVEVIVANRRDSANGQLAIKHGFEPVPVDQAVKQIADAPPDPNTGSRGLIIIAMPDEVQPDVWEKSIKPNLKPGVCLGATHGFNIHFKTIVPPEEVDVVMVAPKGPGHTVRWEFERGGGVPCLMAVHQNPTGSAEEIAMAWSIGVGGGKAGTLKTTFQDETETDLFGEQTVLCGGVSHLIQAAYETLTDAGYPPELAYFEVCHELKLIIDLVVRGGLTYMRYSVSNTAEFGDYHSGPRIIDDHVKQQMRQILSEIQSGEFAKTLRDDYANGFPWFYQQREAGRSHSVETVGKELRGMMPWLDPVDM